MERKSTVNVKIDPTISIFFPCQNNVMYGTITPTYNILHYDKNDN